MELWVLGRIVCKLGIYEIMDLGGIIVDRIGIGGFCWNEHE